MYINIDGPVTYGLFPHGQQSCLNNLYWYSPLGQSHITYSLLVSLCMSKDWHYWILPTLHFPPCQSGCLKMYINIVGSVTHCLFSLCQFVCVQRCILNLLGLSHIAFSTLPVWVPHDVYSYWRACHTLPIPLWLIIMLNIYIDVHGWACHIWPIFPLPVCACKKMYIVIIGSFPHCISPSPVRVPEDAY